MPIAPRILPWLGLFALSAPVAASCGLNPQPEPPGDSTGAAGAGGSVGSGGAGAAAGTGGSSMVDGGGGVAGGGGAVPSPDAGEVDASTEQGAPDGSDDGADATPDALDGGPADAPADTDTITSFVGQMNGIWLVGWSGGLNHFSWVRITSNWPGSWTGTAEFLAGDTLTANAPLWACSGQGQWLIPAKPYSILFTYPAGCPAGLEAEYTFDPFSAPGAYPNGAILAASVAPLSGGGALEGYKFPDTQCNVDMTSCTDPL